MGMLLPLLLALPLAGASALPCGEGTWYFESIGECVTDEECVARGRDAREGGYCREVYEVSTEAELLQIGDHPYETYVLASDIVLTTPWRPTEFWGEIDGQGHWIRSISFDFQAFYDAGHDSYGRTVKAVFLPNATVVKNLGLEAAVDVKMRLMKSLTLAAA